MAEDSPCHYCTKKPCFIHDTCPDYQGWRAGRKQENAKRTEDSLMIDYICASVARTTRKKQRSNRR